MADKWLTDGKASPGPVARGSIARVGVASILQAICGYAVMYLAARDLGPVGFPAFAVFWGAYGLVGGAAYGLLQESTREVRTSSSALTFESLRTRPMRVAAGIGLAATVIIVATSPLWAAQVFAEARPLSVTLLSVGLTGFCIHATLLGMLAGVGNWTLYSSLLVTDVIIRVAIAAATLVLGWGLAGFLWATVAGSVAWLLLLMISPAARAAASISTQGSTLDFFHGALHSIAAAGSSAVLVMGFPVLLKATAGELGAEGGIVILCVTLTRAPLLVPLIAMQGNLVAYFVDRGTPLGIQRFRIPAQLRALAAPAAIVLAVGALGVPLAALLGPWLLRAAFGPDYQASGTLLAWLTAAAVPIALLTLTGAATVASALHRAYSAGWVGATALSTVLLTLPLDLPTRTVTALLCGPLFGIAVHLAALARADSRTDSGQRV